MSRDSALESCLRDYVLGRLAEARRLELEQRLVTDPDVFELLGVVEQDLADEYLDGRLSQRERAQYEDHSLSTARGRKVLEFGRTLQRVAAIGVGQASPRGGWMPRWPVWAPHRGITGTLAAVAVVLLVVCWWAVRGQQRLRGELAELRAENTAARQHDRALQAELGQLRLKTAEIERELARSTAHVASQPPRQAADVHVSHVPVFALEAGITRSGGRITRISIPDSTLLVALAVPIGAQPHGGRYRAAISDPDGEEVFAVSRLRASTTTPELLTFEVPAWVLTPGDYQVRVSEGGSAEPVGTYSVRVLPR